MFIQEQKNNLKSLLYKEGLISIFPKKKLLILAAYITEPDYERFKRYPEVMMMYSTNGTNEEKRDLFITTAKYRHNNVFCLSRCPFTNARNMIFHWKFSISTRFICLKRFVIK